MVLKLNAEHAANEIMITVLFGIDFNRDSPWMAALRTFNADERPAARKNLFTSSGAVGWLITPPYVDNCVCITKISTYGGRDDA